MPLTEVVAKHARHTPNHNPNFMRLTCFAVGSDFDAKEGIKDGRSEKWSGRLVWWMGD